MNTNKKIINGALAGLAIVIWFLMRQVADTVWDIFRLPLPQNLPVAPSDLIGAVIAAAVFIIIKRYQKMNEFMDEAVTELSKVTWPPKKETLLSAVVVSGMVAVCALILFAFDTLWGTVVKLFYQ